MWWAPGEGERGMVGPLGEGRDRPLLQEPQAPERSRQELRHCRGLGSRRSAHPIHGLKKFPLSHS